MQNYYNTDEEKARMAKVIDTLVLEVTKELESNESTQSTEETIKTFVRIQKLVLPTLLAELKNPAYNLFKSRILNQFSSIIGDMLASTIKLREFEIKEEVDMSNPKIQLAFSWLLDLIAESLDEVQMDKKIFFENFAAKIIGWEEKVNKKIGKLTMKAIQASKESFENPLLKGE